MLSITTPVVGITRSRSCEVGTWDLLSWSTYGSASRSGCKTATLGVSERKLDPRENSFPPEQHIAAERGLPREDDVEDGGLPGPPTLARACPNLRVTCGLLQKSLPVSNGLVHILFPVHDLLIQSLERKAIGVTLLQAGPQILPARDSKERTNGSC